MRLCGPYHVPGTDEAANCTIGGTFRSPGAARSFSRAPARTGRGAPLDLRSGRCEVWGVSPPSAYVVIDGPGLEGRVIPLKEGITTVGRLPANDVVLAEGGISRQHARISFFEDRATFQDLGSHNGSQVNGQPVTTHLLQNGDRIAIGAFQLSFRRGPAPDAPEAPAVPEPVTAPRSGLPWEELVRLTHAEPPRAGSLDQALDLLEAHLDADRLAVVRRRWNGRLTVVRNRSKTSGNLVRPVVEWTVRHQLPLASPSPRRDDRFAGTERDGPVACLPLTTDGHLIGALYVERNGSDLEAELQALEPAACLIAQLLRRWERDRPPWRWDGSVRGLVLAVEAQLPGTDGAQTMAGEHHEETAGAWQGFLDPWVDTVARFDGTVVGLEAGRVVSAFPFGPRSLADDLLERLVGRFDPRRLRAGMALGDLEGQSWVHEATQWWFVHGNALDGATALLRRARWGRLLAYRSADSSKWPWRPMRDEPGVLQLELRALRAGDLTQDVVGS